ncbi:AsmA-like C-terminal region-containing protein [Methylocystis sp. JR02]|uniref:AsmA-like C-terminal region-containing protein n=1 Tax=Methylocystis sp. JR02 TaxID=3046284 RepID=UPI0024BB1433|nr:AsmA-like C-terminal region-containing protein [Methylocystis sp. JR02]MDJ0448278.1 AsmA-like C-terminal region-containing protein [Methylocystis sp. JR02]
MSDQTGREHRGDRPAVPRRPPKRRRRVRVPRAVRTGASCGLGGLALVCLAIGAFFLALSHGPIDFGWLAPRIVAALDERFAGQFAFQLAGVSLANSDHGPTLTVDGLVVKSGDRAILAAPRAELSLDWPSILLGRLQPRRLEALDLDVRLSVQADGAIAVSAGGDPVATARVAPPPGVPQSPNDSPLQPNPDAPAPVERVALLKSAAGALRALMDLAISPDSPIGGFDKLGVLHGRLTIDDRTIDRTIQYKDVSLSLAKAQGSMRFSLAATGPSQRWSVTAAAKGAPGRNRALVAKLRNITIDEISLVAGARNLHFDTDSPLGVDLSFSLSPDGIVLEATGGLEIGKGFFRLEEPDYEPVMVQRIAAQARWSRRERKLVVAPFELKAGGFDLALAGSAEAPAELPPGADPGADAWLINAKLVKPSQIAPDRAGEKSVLIEEAALQARLMHGQGRLLLDRLAVSGPDLHASASVAATYRGAPRVIYTLDVDDVEARALMRLWPTHVAAPVRAWFIDHIPVGVVKHAHATGDFDDDAITAMRYERPPPEKSLEIVGDVANCTLIDVLPGLAPMTGVAGKLRVTGRTSAFDATSGMMETAPGHRLTLSEGRFSVADNALLPTPAVLDLKVAGNIEAAADILSMPIVAAHATVPVDGATLKGQIDGRVRVDFEIGDTARGDRTTFGVDANTTNLVVEKLIGKERLEGAALHVLSDRSGLRVNGTGRLYGAPATLELRRGFGEKGPAQAQLTLTFDDAARQRAGYAVAGVSGPVSAIVKTQLPVADDLNAHVELDLTRASFDNPIPGVAKPVGKAAKATFLAVKRGESIALDQFSFDANPMQAQGVIELAKEGGFRSARLAPVRLSTGDDMKVDVSRGGEATKIVVRGANFDARPMLASLIRSGSGGADKPSGSQRNAGDDVSVDVKLPIVTGHGKQILSGVVFEYESRGGRPRTVALTGNFGREDLAVAMTRGQNGAQELDISTNDAGSFLAFLDLYRKMENGVLNANVALGQNRADGAIRIRDFFVKGEPTMRQLMAQGGTARADDRGNLRFDPDLVRVGRLQSNFTWSGGRLSVREGVMSGPEIGLTFDGFIDFPRDRLDLSGSYVPAYALNSLLSNIPVLNLVITGGQNEGIFALNYRVAGALSAPVVSVNPLSAIAPGLMRKIMGVLDGTARMPETR